MLVKLANLGAKKPLAEAGGRYLGWLMGVTLLARLGLWLPIIRAKLGERKFRLGSNQLFA